ncbi:MAG: hypothetical protein Q7T61_16060 [Caulobacter sp.]|nr:hypothetical protein [Caulobacter sp.]
MTVTAPSPRFAAYAGDGGSGPFPLPFRFLAAADVRAVVVAADGGREPLAGLVLEGAGEAAGGQATTPRAIAVGETLVLWTDTALIQPADYIAADAFPAETHEAALDRLTLIAQDLRRDLDRAIKANLGDDAHPDIDYSSLIESVANVVTDDALIAALKLEGTAQVALVAAEGSTQTAAVNAAIGTAAAEIAAEGEAQRADIEAAGEANSGVYFANDIAGLAVAAPDQYFGVQQTHGKGIDWKIDNAGTALFRGFGAGPHGGDIRAIRLQQLSPRLCTQFPPGWEVWWAMDAELTDRAYIPYRQPQQHLGQYRRPANVFGRGDLRDESAGAPIITPNAADGPLGPGTAASCIFAAGSAILGIVNTETHDLINGASYNMRVTMACASGTGPLNYRIGMSGTVDVHYKVCAVPNLAGEDFGDPTNPGTTFQFSFTADNTKQVGIWPSTGGDVGTLLIGSIEVVPADSALPALTSQAWDAFVSRGSASPGGVVLDADLCFINSGLSDPGLIDFPPGWPKAIDYSAGKTVIVLGELVGGAGSSAYAVMSSEDFNNDLSPSTTSSTFGLLFNNTTEEGQFAPYPSYSLGRHAANGIGLGLAPWWNRIDGNCHDYGVGGGILFDYDPAFAAWSGRAERVGSYNGSRDITQVLTTNKMRIAAKARLRRRATNSELAQAIRAMQEQAAVAGMALGDYTDWIGLIGDSNDDRSSATGGTWPFRISASGFMGQGRQNCIMSVRAVGGKGLYSGAGVDWAVDMTTGFVAMLEALKPGIEFALELGLKPGIKIRPGTNDYGEINADVDRYDDELTQHIRDPILSYGAALLEVDMLPCLGRFTEAKCLQHRANQKAYADAHGGRVWHLNGGNSGLWLLANQASYFLSEGGEYIHLDPATGDPAYAAQVRDGLINVWREERA